MRGSVTRYALIYGAIAGAIAVLAIIAGIVFELPNHFQSEWFGYLVMLIALSLIFVGVKRYRDVECGGVIGFRRALATGLGISVVAGLIYVAVWETYVALSGIDYMADYSAKTLGEMRANGASDAEIAATIVQLRDLSQSLRNPLFRLPMTFMEIFPVGLVVSLIAATALRNPRVFPARA